MSRSKSAAVRVGGILGGAGVLFVGGVLLASAPAFADNGPHISMTNTDLANTQGGIGGALGGGCASCHRAHSAKALGAGGDLLVQDETAMCESCHGAAGNGSTTNVMDGVGYASSNGLRTGAANSALRGGGFDNAALDASNATRGPGVASAYSANGWGITKTANVIGVLGGATTPTPTTATSNHSVGVANSTVWGNGAFSVSANYGKTGVTLECGSCHDPHGNGNYRILKPVPVGSGVVYTDNVTSATADGTLVTYTLKTPAQFAAGQTVSITGNSNAALNLPKVTIKSVTLADTKSLTASAFTVSSAVAAATTGTGGTAVPVFPDAATKTYTTANYWKEGGSTPDAPNNAAATPVNSFIANVSSWCATCHTRYLADSSGRSVASGDSVFTYRHRSDNGKQDSPNCLQCHVAHGTNAEMSGTSASTGADTPGSSTANPPTGDHGSKLLRVSNRGVCQMCHNK